MSGMMAIDSSMPAKSYLICLLLLGCSAPQPPSQFKANADAIDQKFEELDRQKQELQKLMDPKRELIFKLEVPDQEF